MTCDLDDLAENGGDNTWQGKFDGTTLPVCMRQHLSAYLIATPRILTIMKDLLDMDIVKLLLVKNGVTKFLLDDSSSYLKKLSWLY